MSMRTARCLLILFTIVCRCALAQTPVRYILSLADPERHRVQVTMQIPPGHEIHELQLPVWNALYQVRDFSQYINWIRAEDANANTLKITQLNKSRWRIDGITNGGRVQYEMFSDNPDPYGAQLNPRHAFFNLAEILLYADHERSHPTEIEFNNVPQGWKIATALGREGSTYKALNYDQLVDSPVEIGTFEESDFSATCGKYRVIVDSGNAQEILRKIVPPIQRIVSAATTWMNNCPFQSYLFIYHISDAPGGGGMEHAFSTAITLPRKDVENNLDQFTSVSAHEFFHLWNVKRIRPQSLEPIDYTKENYTTALWFSEGVDSTVGEYIRLRAGLLDERHYLDHLGQEITELENRPAHLTQSAEQSSVDAWLEKYPYYGLPQRSISYYNKGELLGVLLDLSMRNASRDQASLRELFRWMNDHYAKQGKYFADSEAVRKSAENLSHADLRDFFRKYVSGTAEIPWDTFFAQVGLHVAKTEVTFPDSGFDTVQRFDQPPEVVKVYPGTEAERAGVKPGDVIIKIDGQAAGRQFEKQLAKLAPGTLLHLTIRRDGVERQLEYRLGSRKQMVYQLQDVPNMSAQQKGRRAAWLFDSASEGGASAK